jgi:hypothetical protein
MLYKYRIKNRKEYFNTSLEKIKNAFNICMDSIKCIELEHSMSGGSIYKVTYYENKLNKLYNQINIASIN